MAESMKVLVSSKYVRDLATLVVAYGISINLVEVTWKSKLKAQVILFTFLFSSLQTVLFLWPFQSSNTSSLIYFDSSLVQMNTHLSWVISLLQLELQLSR